MSLISGMPSLSISFFVAGSNAQRNTSKLPAVVTENVPLFTVPENPPATVTISDILTLIPLATSSAELPEVSSHDQAPVESNPPSKISALPVGDAVLLPAVKELLIVAETITSPVDNKATPVNESLFELPPDVAQPLPLTESIIKKASLFP